MADLTLVVQGREVRSFPLKSGTTSIGRSPDNDIVINNLALSRRHAEVRAEGLGFKLFDLGSQNGVFLNGERIRGGVELSDEDTITLGTYGFVFRQPQASPPPEGPLLVLTFNEVELQRFSFPPEGRCRLGRGRDCDLQIAERRLSRRHCEIVQEGEAYILRDLGSQNGTYVNRRRIPRQQALAHGDVLNFAEYSVLFLLDAAAYDGPDKRHLESAPAPAAPAPEPAPPSPKSGPVRPVSKPRGQVFVEPPERARARHQPLTARPAPVPAPPRPPSIPSAHTQPLPRDIEDPKPTSPPDAALDDWYDSRRPPSQPGAEEAVLLERNVSAVSEVLGSMMVEREEVDEGLHVQPAARRFSVEVRAHGELVHQGPITREVTIMGREAEADIQLRGRYVAGRHSLLVRVRDSLLLVRLGSSSAARVNGLPKLQAFLRDGDLITIDETTIKIIEG